MPAPKTICDLWSERGEDVPRSKKTNRNKSERVGSPGKSLVGSLPTPRVGFANYSSSPLSHLSLAQDDIQPNIAIGQLCRRRVRARVPSPDKRHHLSPPVRARSPQWGCYIAQRHMAPVFAAVRPGDPSCEKAGQREKSALAPNQRRLSEITSASLPPSRVINLPPQYFVYPPLKPRTTAALS